MGIEAEHEAPALNRVVIVTGMSGAGLSSSLKCLEDHGFDVIDNLPIPLFKALINAKEPFSSPLAIGIASRTRGLVPTQFCADLATLRRDQRLELTMLFLDCQDEVLRRRFTETRRRHPLTGDEPVMDSIARERSLLAPLKVAADLRFDTTSTLVSELRTWLGSHLSLADRPPLTITLVSFAYRHGLPQEADLVLDARFLRNPYYVQELRDQTGLMDTVQAYVRADPDFGGFWSNLQALLLPLLPRFKAEGKSYLTIAIGCTGGQHRSVFIAQLLGLWLTEEGWPANIIHRELNRTAFRHQPGMAVDAQGTPR
ncbi:UPF0042 nucleotide-binding protein [Arboricoccus pini]|uniref:UPF0042 nucleotide-binding protein n=1 Tax=Arboricoccus pini TaxID=1963835 RepID=A0A212QZP0_9PROT|nr:RNase adapter RapZ [Arboricoccus pini]SNB65218.1 UPF0042 nucleotide-binding protein [Arboricoccus pini]